MKEQHSIAKLLDVPTALKRNFYYKQIKHFCCLKRIFFFDVNNANRGDEKDTNKADWMHQYGSNKGGWRRFFFIFTEKSFFCFLFSSFFICLSNIYVCCVCSLLLSELSSLDNMASRMKNQEEMQIKDELSRKFNLFASCEWA